MDLLIELVAVLLNAWRARHIKHVPCPGCGQKGADLNGDFIWCGMCGRNYEAKTRVQSR